MRIPVKSERDAFRLAYGAAAVLALAILLGALIAPIAGVALVALVVVAGLVWELMVPDAERPTPLREAASANEGAADGRHRILVVANQTVAGQELRDELMTRAESDPEVRVVCPILPSRAHLITSDIDREIAEARRRLEATLAWASEQGFSVTGKVSEDTPVTAVCDELRTFAADEVIVSTHPRSRSRWLESDLIGRLETELDVPITHVVVDLEREQAAASA
jgi:hypothetical protein